MRNEKKVFVKMIAVASISVLGTCALLAGDGHAESIANDPQSSLNVWYEILMGFRDAFAVFGVIGLLVFVRKKLQGGKKQGNGKASSSRFDNNDHNKKGN